jgi:hypothetical protein
LALAAYSGALWGLQWLLSCFSNVYSQALACLLPKLDSFWRE